MTPTKLRHFLEPLVKGDHKSALRDFAGAVVFSRFVLGFKVAEDLLEHPWLKGVLRAANVRTKDAHQSRVLKVQEVA